jgi:nucleotide-binding universal stress UspA family protein
MDSQAGRIVVGYDGSPTAGAALDWAAAEAQRRQLPLTVLSVIDYLGVLPGSEGVLPGQNVSKEETAQMATEGVLRAQKVADGIDISPITLIARVADSLIQTSRDAALLVVGTRGHGDVTGALLGSVAFAVSAHAHCPVVVVRGDSSRPSGPERPVVVGVDGSDSAQAAIRYAADVAATSSAPLIIAAAYRPVASQAWATTLPYALESDEDTTFDAIARQKGEAAVAAAVHTALEIHPGLDVRRQVVEGPAARVLADVAAGCGLLVVGSRGHGGFVGLMLGSVSHGAIHLAPCPVAIVR